MQYKESLNTKIPIIGLGTARLVNIGCEEVIISALDLGYRLFDTASLYNNEKEIGNAIKKSSINRKEIQVISKIFKTSNSYKLAYESIEKTLDNLGFEYIDFMLLHEPYPEFIEMYQAMIDAKNKKMIKNIGVSNFEISDLNLLNKEFKSDLPFLNQVECHVYKNQNELKKNMGDANIILQAWSPLTKRRSNLLQDRVICSIAERYKRTNAQIALKYLIQNGICIIPKASTKEHLVENLSLFDFTLSKEDLFLIDRLNKNQSFDPRFRN